MDLDSGVTMSGSTRNPFGCEKCLDPQNSDHDRDPNMFDGSYLKKLRGFLLQCKLNFRSKPKSLQTEQLKVNCSLSFLKGIALDYFEPYLADDPANEPAWLNDYELFVEELLIYFSPYNMMADGEVELEQLVMKDNHKATKFFIDFY